MGYMRHHAIIVTSFSPERLKKAHKIAKAIFPEVTKITKPVVNGYTTFMIPPDGSKEGWNESHYGDARRNKFISILSTDNTFVDYCTWAEVQFGDDNGIDIITRKG